MEYKRMDSMNYSVPRNDTHWWDSGWHPLPDSQEESQAVIDSLSQVTVPQQWVLIFHQGTKFIIYLEDRSIKILANSHLSRVEGRSKPSPTRRLLPARDNSEVPLGPPIYYQPALDTIRINRDLLDTRDLWLLQDLAGQSMVRIQDLEVWDHYRITFEYCDPHEFSQMDQDGHTYWNRTVMSFFPGVRTLTLAPFLTHRDREASKSFSALK
jgi:hypothetical protein